MKTTTVNPTLAENPLFDSFTGELLPAHRDAYLHGRLTPEQARQVEAYLDRSPIQSGVMLGRYHELAAAARQQGRTLPASAWLQRQLLFQPTVSRVGPLRRPVVRVALTMFLGLCGASVVQWIRNEPLIPKPVVEAVARAATSASVATQELVQKFTEPAAEEAPQPAVAAAPKRKAPAGRKPAAQPAPAAAAPVVASALEVRRTSLATALGDSVRKDLPASLSARPGEGAAPGGLLRGRIVDGQGRPLAGATVLVRGTQIATSTNAAGEYTLDVPPGATLLFGYGGFDDQQLRHNGTGTLNVVLQPNAEARRRRLISQL